MRWSGRPPLAQAVDEQLEVIARLRAEADHSYAEAVRTVGVQSADGTLLRGEVLARWHEFVGTGEFFRALEHKVSWLRDRVVAVFRGEPPGTGNLKVAVESGLESLLRDEADAAAERAEASWQANAAGRQLVEQSAEDLSRSSPDFPRAAERAIRDWQGGVLDLVADEGMGNGVEGPVPGPWGERDRGGADDRRLRAHRRVGGCRGRCGGRHGRTGPAGAGGGSATRRSAGWPRPPRRIWTPGCRH